MRVLLVNDSARSHTGGGNRVVVETCEWLMRSGHQVALAYHDSGSAEVSCPVFRVPSQWAVSAPEVLTALDRTLTEFKPDVVHLHTMQMMCAFPMLAARVPSAVFQHDQSWFCAGGDRMHRGFRPCHKPHGLPCFFWNYATRCGALSPRTNIILWRRVNERVALHDLQPIRIQVASRFMREGLLENGYGQDRIDVIPLFAEPPPIQDATEPGLILCPSRLVRGKGVQVLLDAVAKLAFPAWRLIVPGTGPMANRLRDQAAGLGIADRVEFPGEVSSQTMAGLYARAQVVAFPVLRHEPFGLVGVESLAYAKPIVAFAGGAVEEWLWPDETGVRVDERTPDAFASAMDLLLSNPSRCAGMGRAARARYGFFTPAKYVERLVEAYERCIAWHRESAGSAL